jgi:hypothetical protein
MFAPKGVQIMFGKSTRAFMALQDNRSDSAGIDMRLVRVGMMPLFSTWIYQ